ncbi:MAG: YkvA family protein [Gammaproteobacteria bacterium]|nr:YkvA family protein [Gammaproteobacteria bacterium]
MSLRVSFDLDEDDLNHFRLIMHEARKTVAHRPPEDIVAAAELLLQDSPATSMPGFIRERIDNLKLLIQMLTDLEWRLPHADAGRVLNALAYFTEPEDLIPDQIPGLGFLDDAIMVELVMRELAHEIEAYRDFCDLRTANCDKTATTRTRWLNGRREELQARMRQRREQDIRDSAKRSDLRLLD